MTRRKCLNANTKRVSLRIWRVFLLSETWYNWESCWLYWQCGLALFCSWQSGCHTMWQYWKWGHFQSSFCIQIPRYGGLTLKLYSWEDRVLAELFLYIKSTFPEKDGFWSITVPRYLDELTISTFCWLKEESWYNMHWSNAAAVSYAGLVVSAV